MAVVTYTSTGSKASIAAKLDKDVFGIMPGSYVLLKAAYEAYLANGRGNYAQALRRGEVSGGGRKPWRQKGTGRARFGSSRNPIWRGGGVAFGPTGNENYTHKLTTKSKQQATRQALSLAVTDGRLIVVESVSFKNSKTAEAAKFMLKIGAKGNTVFAVANKTDEITRATRNLANVKLVSVKYLNVFDIINADHLVITNDSLKVLSEWLGNAPVKVSKGDQ